MTNPNDDISVSSADSSISRSSRGGNKVKKGADKASGGKSKDQQPATSKTPPKDQQHTTSKTPPKAQHSASKEQEVKEKDEKHGAEHETKKELKKSPPRSFMYQASK